MAGLKAEEQLKQENGNIFSNKEKISSVLKTAVKDKLAQMDCLIDDDLPNYIMIMMANRKSKKEMTEALHLFLNERTNDFTTWLYQMLDSIRKRREKIKEIEDKKETNNNKDLEEEAPKTIDDAGDELEIGVGEEDDLDRELIGDDEIKPVKAKSPPKVKVDHHKVEQVKKVDKKIEKIKSGSMERKSRQVSSDKPSDSKQPRNEKSRVPTDDDKRKKRDSRFKDITPSKDSKVNKNDVKKNDNRKTDQKPKLDAKSKSDQKPKVDTKLKQDTKPKVGTKLKMDLKPRPDGKPKTDSEADKKKAKNRKEKKDGESTGNDTEGKKKAKDIKPDLRKMLESKRKRKPSEKSKPKKATTSSSSSSSSSSDSSSSDEEPAKKKKKKVDPKTTKKGTKGKKKADTKAKAKKRKAKKEASSTSESDEAKKADEKNLKDLVIMVKNNETAKKKKRRRKTRDMRDKRSKLAKINESGSGDSQTEQSDKSKKAIKQRSLERKERSLLKQKKRLMRLHEKAKKVDSPPSTNAQTMPGKDAENHQNMQSGMLPNPGNVGNILYMPVDGKLQAVQIVQHQGMTMLAPVMPGMGMQSGSSTPGNSRMAPPSAGGPGGQAPIFGQAAKLGQHTPPGIAPGTSALSGLGTAAQSPLATNSISSTSFATLAHSNTTIVATPKEGQQQKEVKLKTDTKIINNTAKAPTDKTTDIDTLKKKLAMMERETSRLREMHKLRLKKLETKQRAQEERSKRDAEIQRRQDEEDARTVYVRNLHPKIKEQQLRDHFSVFGAIKRIVLPQDAHAIGNNRGFTFITFASKEPVEVACSLDGTLFHERSIKVVPKSNMMGKIRPQHIVH